MFKLLNISYEKDMFRFYIAFYTAKLTRFLLKILRRNASFFPGKVAVTICPDFLGKVSKPEKIIGVTGTNGKTTVCNLLIKSLEDDGYKVLDNRLGSNVNSGLASAFISGTNLLNKTKYQIAVLEIDERSSPKVYPYVKPTYLICTNLFRDSIRRNANPEFISSIIN
ncbi:MAG: Mur ligase family protein, partial [Clostridia bacterium]